MLWSLKRYYINTLKQELSTAKTYENDRLDETSIVDMHRCHMAAKFGLLLTRTSSPLMLILVHVQLLSCLFF